MRLIEGLGVTERLRTAQFLHPAVLESLALISSCEGPTPVVDHAAVELQGLRLRASTFAT